MTAIHAFLFGTAFAVFTSTTVALVLRGDLRRLFEELMQSAPRAAFWGTACLLCVLLLGLFAGTTSGGYGDLEDIGPTRLFFGVVRQVRFALFGLLFGILGTSALALLFVARYERREERRRRELAAGQ